MASGFFLANHDRVLESYGRPKWLVTTKPSFDSNEEFTEEATDLRHNYWIIRSEDPDKVLDPELPLDFAQPVDFGGVLLTHEPLACDLLTAKIIAIEAMRGQYMTMDTAKALAEKLRHVFWIVRWRLALGLTNMQQITPSLFDDYCDRLRQGVVALVPMEDRLRQLEAQLQSRQWSWPTYFHQSTQRIDFEALAAWLGIPRQMLISPWMHPRITSLIGRTNPKIYFSQAGDSGPREPEDLDGDSRSPQPSVSVATQALTAWKRLAYLSDIGLLPHDPITFDPFEKVSLVTRARQIGRTPGVGEGRTGTPRPEQWLALLDGAARWVLDYSGPILTICRLAREVQGDPSNIRKQKKRMAAFRQAVEAIIAEHLPPNRPGVPRLVPQWRRTGRNSPAYADGMMLEEALGHLVTACLVLIAGLSARRRDEVRSLQAGCTVKDPFGNWWLSSYIEKTIRDIEQIPVPAMVAVAVRLLEELSESARERTGKNWLVKIHRPSLTHVSDEDQGRVYIETALRFTLNDFAEVVGASESKDGVDWKFAPHQLRRAFSVYYYHGNRFSSLDALSRFLLHFDPEMTRLYITEAIPGTLTRLREVIDARLRSAEEMEQPGQDAVLTSARAAMISLEERAREHEDVRQDAFVERVLDMYDGAESPIGFGAAALYDELEKMIESARRSVLISGRSNLSPDREREALVRLLRDAAPNRYIEPHPGRHTHCGCRPGDPSDLADAVCLRKKAGEAGPDGDYRPDYAFASTEDCLACRHCVAFGENVTVINRRVDQIAAAAEKAPTEPSRVAAKAKLDSLKAKIAAAKAAVHGKHRG
ncbi:site-specific integrase [Microvirga arsenatis]|uniref:Tyr recombinase domain-containing protein n=1 Tax=Microvirga arsenatis TaxID=2692265 RepID=A0ABW9Z135_9HYPH|nr:site-specific integrase [Microvirga arsenatis]NBJ10738.1 hypothetical protein [Microvirga arsenatis]NBJ24364.1 hypothetical protein [Microvirga arsenatis]